MALYKLVSGAISGHSVGDDVEMSDKDYEILKKDETLELEPVSSPKPGTVKPASAKPQPSATEQKDG